jgi:flagellar hook-basal body complex protein FliE
VDNVRQTEDEVAKKEYLLSTGQLDNPVELSMALYKAETSVALFVQLRDKALSAYSELSRISL